ESAGVQMIAVHGRTRQQFYKGTARWKPVRDVVDAVKIPVIVNGDIIDPKSARLALHQSGAAGVMIGRAAQGQPWLVGQINASLSGCRPTDTPQSDTLLAIIVEHYHAMLEAYGVDMGVRVARKHLRWYLEAADIQFSVEQRRQLLTQSAPKDTLDLIRRFITLQSASFSNSAA
ncbi:MAG: tRNA-dihydrouridine synthase, partial [Devosiaceae bacterium]|nr:tRNA-dihydrouridine synthase [Devosiaceae bacterium]